MPCKPIPTKPIPAFPEGLSLSAPVPPLPAEPNIPDACCTLPALPTLDIPNPLGPLFVNPAVVTAIRAALLAAEEWADSVAIPCPRQ